MSAVRRSAGVLSQDATMKLLALAANQDTTSMQLANDLFALLSASPARTHNTIAFLSEIGALSEGAGKVRLSNEAASAPDLRQFVQSALMERYFKLISGAALGATFQLGDGPSDVRIDRLRLPLRERGYPYLLLEFGIATRSSAEERFWRVAPEAVDTVLGMLLAASEQPFRSKQFSLDALKDLQAAKEAAGREAEEFVVSFERRRLALHPFVSSLRRISEEDAGAGFDVLSFENGRTLAHDRFIEVKGYSDEESFYWSAGEMRAAEHYGNGYWLYLVDRKRLTEQGYQPEMVQDPYTYFVVHQPLSWLVEPQSLKFLRTGRPG